MANIILRKVLKKKFFDRPTLIVAKDLLGKFLVREVKGEIIASMITEVEAYDGLKDMASHARRGVTPRNKIMFGHPGIWYVYFTYGMHWMVNIITGPENYPAGVLIRGVEGVSGPGRVTKYFRIDRDLNGKRAEPKENLWLEDRGTKIEPKKIKRTPRVGIDHAGPVWAKKKYRFTISY